MNIENMTIYDWLMIISLGIAGGIVGGMINFSCHIFH